MSIINIIRKTAPLAAAALLPCALPAAPVPRIEKLEPRIWRCDFQSEALGREMCFIVVMPVDSIERGSTGTPAPAVYFLHGAGRDENAVIGDRYCRRLVMASRCAFVLPRGLNGWYVNSRTNPGDRFADYVDEVIELAGKNFPLRTDAAGRAIGGWSMGGYGAAYTFARRPNDFAALASIIGIIDYPRERIEPPDQNFNVYGLFGADRADWAMLNPRLLLASVPRKPVFVAYADKAAERQMNEAFIAEAKKLEFPVRALCIPGGHAFPVVREAMPAALGFLELQLF
jgi:S-formylglutathione hydrolase FrmB